MCDTDATFWSNQRGEKVLFSHGSSRSGGVVICFNTCPGKIVTVKADEDGHWLAVVLNVEGTFIILTNVYGKIIVTKQINVIKSDGCYF